MLMQDEKTRKQVAPLCNINNFDDMAPLRACQLCRIICHQRCGPNTQIRHTKAKKKNVFTKSNKDPSYNNDNKSEHCSDNGV